MLMDETLTAGYRAGSQFLQDAIALIPDDGWDQPGLGTWTLRELVGHANRAHTLIEEYLLRPRPPEPPDSPYFHPDAIAARGREAVADLGDDPPAAVAAAAAAAIALIGRTDPDATVGSPIRAMPLREYVPSRTAELTIHALDVAAALGADLTPPPAALQESLVFTARLSALRSAESGTAVLLALSGRGALPDGYSAYP
jgi:uncharacterized protein (TIGR03083 family)